MFGTISAKTGQVPVVSTFFSVSEDVEKHVDRIFAVYNIAIEALRKGIEGKIPDPIVGDEGCQIRALFFSMKMKDCSYQDLLKNSLLALESRISIVKKVQEALKEHKIQMEKKMKPLKAELQGWVKKEKRIQREQPKTPELMDQGEKEATDSFSLDSPTLDTVQTKIKEIQGRIKPLEKEDRESLAGFKAEVFEELFIPEDAMTYVISDILTIVKKKRTATNPQGQKIGHDDTEPLHMKSLAKDLVSNDLKQIVKTAQKVLAKVSVDFIQSEAKKCICNDSKLLQEMAAKVKIVKHNSHGEHPEIPCFHYTRVVFQRALEEKIPVILKVRNVKKDPYILKDYSHISLFEVADNASCYSLAKGSISPGTLAIVMECRTEMLPEEIAKESFIEELIGKTGGIIPLIEHLVAQHVQYTDQNREANFTTYFENVPMPEEEKKRIIEMGSHAIEIGITPHKPSLCCPEHIYCSTIGNEMGGHS